MVKKIALSVAVIVLVAAAGLFLWARSVFTHDGVRAALAEQLTKALGQPVHVGGVAATIYPRVTMRLEEVTIGQPARIQVHTLDVGTDFRALLSRRIEHAALHLNGARIELPLPALGGGTTSPTPSTPASRSAPVELVSIDEIVLKGVEIVSGSRSLRGDVELVPRGKGATLRKMSLSADGTTVTVTGAITDLAGPSGDLAVKAGTLNFDKLLAFMSEFSAGAGMTSSPATSARSKSASAPMRLSISLDAERATMGAMVIDKLAGRAVIRNQDVVLSPLTFYLFGGRYDGSLDLATAGSVPEFHWKASLAGIDIAKAAAFGGSPDTVSGKLDGRIDLAGRGTDAGTAIRLAHGTARIDATNGVVRNLGLIRAVVAATSLNAGAVAQTAMASRDEPFSRLGMTLAIAGGSASTRDLLFESESLSLSAAGTLRLDGSSANFQGNLQLSEALSKQTAAAVFRVTQQSGRVTLPATVTGKAGSYSVSVDAASLAKRALRNEAAEQTKKAITKGLGDLFKKK